MAESRFRHFDGMTWPDPQKIDELAWRLTHAPESVTREDQLVAASVISAYQQIISDGRTQREYVCRKLRQPPAPAEEARQ